MPFIVSNCATFPQQSEKMSKGSLVRFLLKRATILRVYLSFRFIAERLIRPNFHHHTYKLLFVLVSIFSYRVFVCYYPEDKPDTIRKLLCGKVSVLLK